MNQRECETCEGYGWLAAYGEGDQASGWADTCQECKGKGYIKEEEGDAVS